MCSHLFGKSSGAIEGGIGDVLGGLAGAYFGGPIGAAAGAEIGGTVGGVAGGEKVGQAALNALPAAGVAGIGAYGAEAMGSSFPGSGGTDLFGVSGTPAAPSAVSAAGPSPFGGATGDVIAASNVDTTGAGADGYIDPQTGLPVPPTPPATAPLPGATTAAPVDRIDAASYPTPAGGATSTAAPVAGATDSGGNPISNAYHYLFGTSATQPAAPAADGSTPGVVGNVAKSLGLNTGQLLSAGIAGGGLIRNVMAGSNLQGQPQLSAQAQRLAQQSEMMQSYLQTGTLPPGVKTAVDNATAGAKAAIKAKYAGMGIPGSSAEQQELQQVELNAAAQSAELAIKLYTEGTQNADISAQIYQTLLSTDQKQQQLTQDAIANMAAALSGQGGAYQHTIGQPAVH